MHSQQMEASKTQARFKMKQGGLDTLAALCGGASKAYTEEREDENAAALSNQTGSSGPAPAPSIQPFSPSPTETVSPGQSIVTVQNAAPVTSAGPMDPSMQQWQSLATAAAAYGSVPNPASFASFFQAAAQNPASFQQPPASTVDPNLYMQQFAYYQYLAAAQAQQMASQNGQQMVVTVQGPTHSPASVAQPAFSIDPKVAAPYIYVGHQGPAHQASSGELFNNKLTIKNQELRLLGLFVSSLLRQIRIPAAFFTCDVGGICFERKILW